MFDPNINIRGLNEAYVGRRTNIKIQLTTMINKKLCNWKEGLCVQNIDLEEIFTFHSRFTIDNRCTWFIHMSSDANSSANILLTKLSMQEIIWRVRRYKPLAVTVNDWILGTILAEGIHSSTETYFKFDKARLLIVMVENKMEGNVNRKN
jgi:hypothetical protein